MQVRHVVGMSGDLPSKALNPMFLRGEVENTHRPADDDPRGLTSHDSEPSSPLLVKTA